MCTRYTLSARAQIIINLTTNSVHALVPGSYTMLPRTDATEVAWSLIMCDGWMDQPAIQRPIHRNLCTIHSNFSARFTADQIAHQQRCCFHHEVSPPCRGIPHYSRRYPRRDLHFGRDQYFHGRGRSFCFGTGCVYSLLEGPGDSCLKLHLSPDTHRIVSHILVIIVRRRLLYVRRMPWHGEPNNWDGSGCHLHLCSAGYLQLVPPNGFRLLSGWSS